MDAHKFEQLIRDRLKEINGTPIGSALKAGLPRDAIRSVLRGHPPTLPRAGEICDALGLGLSIEPKQEHRSVGHARSIPNSFISDREIVDVVCAFSDTYKKLNPYGREMFLIRFKHAFPELFDGINIQQNE